MNDAGRMVERWWLKLDDKFENVETDAFVVMPNHFHGIIMVGNDVVGAGLRACPDERHKEGHPQRGAPTVSLPDVMYGFKSMTTTLYRRGVETKGWPPFHKRLWQRNYYEHVIRNEEGLNRIREYIRNNPMNWEWDGENPEKRT